MKKKYVVAAIVAIPLVSLSVFACLKSFEFSGNFERGVQRNVSLKDLERAVQRKVSLNDFERYLVEINEESGVYVDSSRLILVLRGSEIDDDVFLEILNKLRCVVPVAPETSPTGIYLEIANTSITKKSLDALFSEPVAAKIRTLAVGDERLFTDDDLEIVLRLLQNVKELHIHGKFSPGVQAAIAAQRALLGKRNGGKSPLVFNAETKRFL